VGFKSKEKAISKQDEKEKATQAPSVKNHASKGSTRTSWGKVTPGRRKGGLSTGREKKIFGAKQGGGG